MILIAKTIGSRSYGTNTVLTLTATSDFIAHIRVFINTVVPPYFYSSIQYEGTGIEFINYKQNMLMEAGVPGFLGVYFFGTIGVLKATDVLKLYIVSNEEATVTSIAEVWGDISGGGLVS